MQVFLGIVFFTIIGIALVGVIAFVGMVFVLTKTPLFRYRPLVRILRLDDIPEAVEEHIGEVAPALAALGFERDRTLLIDSSDQVGIKTYLGTFFDESKLRQATVGTAIGPQGNVVEEVIEIALRATDGRIVEVTNAVRELQFSFPPHIHIERLPEAKVKELVEALDIKHTEILGEAELRAHEPERAIKEYHDVHEQVLNHLIKEGMLRKSDDGVSAMPTGKFALKMVTKMGKGFLGF